jgi:hypothetical protein
VKRHRRRFLLLDDFCPLLSITNFSTKRNRICPEALGMFLEKWNIGHPVDLGVIFVDVGELVTRVVLLLLE